jgi:hypothetical protein
MVAAFVMIAFLTFPMRWWLIGRHAGLTIPSLMRPHMATLLAGAVMAMAVMAVAPVTGELRVLPELLFRALIGALVYAAIALLVMRRRLAMTRDYLTGLGQPVGAPKTGVDGTA